ncbi:MAG TPA: hypothetical protein VFJ43_06475 [Bacteroidia bacterium]|nr:hypothetical protein [Bacteroidia bacterium]
MQRIAALLTTLMLFGNVLAQASSIRGEWSCVKTVTPVNINSEPNSFPDENTLAPIESPGIENWVISEDSIWVFEYPCQFIAVSPYRFRNDSLFYNQNSTASAFIQFQNNMMIIHQLYKNQLVKSLFFVADSFDQNLVKRLIRDTINSECLTGSFALKQCSCAEKITDCASDCKIHVPSKITIDSLQATSLKKGAEIKLRVGLRKRSFYVVNYAWADYEGQYVNAFNRKNLNSAVLTVESGSWWKGEPVLLTYRFNKK